MSDSPLHVYSEKYPPVKQARTSVGSIASEVVDADGTHRFDPNSASLAGQTGSWIRKLGRPVAVSVISGEPAYLYRNEVVEIPLTAEEIARLFSHSLEPHEWLALAKTYGVFYDIMSSFYNEETGLALSPNYSHAQRVARDAVEHLPHLLVVKADHFWQMHSVVGLSQSDSIFGDLATNGYDVRRLPIERPDDGAELGLLDNVIALHVLSGGALRAFGPYKHTAAAEQAGAESSAVVTVATLPSFIG